jgi:hypothetical protein
VLDALQHLLDDLGLAAGVLAEGEEEALDDDGEPDRRDEKDGPHDFAAGGKQLHRRFVEEDNEG